MKAVILAAGDGGRLGEHTTRTPKPLVQLNGRPLISYTLDALRDAGVSSATIVLGYKADQVQTRLRHDPHGLRLSYALNPRYYGGASISLRAARQHVEGEPFLLVMSDHVLSPGIISALLDAHRDGGPSLLAVDSSAWPDDYVDEATRVAFDPESRLITRIGKQITAWDALDTGAFLMQPDIWDAVAAAPPDCELSPICSVLLQRGRFAAVDATGHPWYDIDTGDDLHAAGERLTLGGGR
ncbi:MAG TPA: NTP transferase domain-containing protein [Tepidiformaceae bacterium]|nr:NTP transferase domain-containing protein [Tepidiformaceae bacterium]